MSEQDDDREMVTCRKCGKAFDRNETPEFECDGYGPEDYCEECGPELGQVDCERLRDFVEKIIDECEQAQRYMKVELAIHTLEVALEMDAPERASDDPRRLFEESCNTPEDNERLNEMARLAGLNPDEPTADDQ